MTTEPAPIPDDDWQDRAACRGKPSSWWFVERPEVGHYPTDPYRQARAICETCPVTAACLDLAMSVETGHRFGMFGGLTPVERDELPDGQHRRCEGCGAALTPRQGRWCMAPECRERYMSDRMVRQQVRRVARRAAPFAPRPSDTECRAGHDWDEANTYIQPSTGKRVCRACKARRAREAR